jgi:uncharacterized protein (TIGR00266 family)
MVQVRTRHTPAAGVARLVLGAGELVQVEAGAVMATSYGVAVEARSPGGAHTPFARAIAGESPVLSVCTAPGQGGWVDVVPGLPGEVYVIELDGRGEWCVATAGWLASAGSVHWDAYGGGLGELFGGQDGFVRHVSGQGPVVVACYGALDVVTLQPGEYVTIDAGYVVAFAANVQSRLRQFGQGATQPVKTGEGLVFDFAGPGQVLTQTRNPRALASWLRALGNDARF